MFKPVAYFAIIASLFLAEESVISSYQRTGSVDGIQINKSMIEEMSDAVSDINWEDLSQNSIQTVVGITEKILSAAVNPIVEYGRSICDEATQMARETNKDMNKGRE